MCFGMQCEKEILVPPYKAFWQTLELRPANDQGFTLPQNTLGTTTPWACEAPLARYPSTLDKQGWPWMDVTKFELSSPVKSEANPLLGSHGLLGGH